jgi:hypothetical protein
MNNKLWFVCPKCFLAFYSKGECEHHCESYHPGLEFKSDLIESKG